MTMKKTNFKRTLVFALIAFGVLVFSTCRIGLGGAVDTQKPTVSITYPPAGSVIRGDFVLQGLATDETALKDITISFAKKNESNGFYEKVNGIQNLVTTVNPENDKWTVNINTPYYDGSGKVLYPLDDGEYEITVTATDNAERQNVTNGFYKIDNTAPVLILTQPATVANEAQWEFGNVLNFAGLQYDNNMGDDFTFTFYDENNVEMGSLKGYAALSNWEISFENEDVVSALLSGVSDIPKKYWFDVSVRDSSYEYKNPDETEEEAILKTGNKSEWYYSYSKIVSLMEQGERAPKVNEIYSIENSKNLSRSVGSSDLPKKLTMENLKLLQILSELPENKTAREHFGVFSVTNAVQPTVKIDNVFAGIAAIGNHVSRSANMRITIEPGKNNTQIETASIKYTLKKWVGTMENGSFSEVIETDASFDPETIVDGTTKYISFIGPDEKGQYQITVNAKDYANNVLTNNVFNFTVNESIPSISLSPGKKVESKCSPHEGDVTKFAVTLTCKDDGNFANYSIKEYVRNADGSLREIKDLLEGPNPEGSVLKTTENTEKEGGKINTVWTWKFLLNAPAEGEKREFSFDVTDGHYYAGEIRRSYEMDTIAPSLYKVIKPEINTVSGHVAEGKAIKHESSVTVEGLVDGTDTVFVYMSYTKGEDSVPPAKNVTNDKGDNGWKTVRVDTEVTVVDGKEYLGFGDTSALILPVDADTTVQEGLYKVWVYFKDDAEGESVPVEYCTIVADKAAPNIVFSVIDGESKINGYENINKSGSYMYAIDSFDLEIEIIETNGLSSEKTIKTLTRNNVAMPANVFVADASVPNKWSVNCTEDGTYYLSVTAVDLIGQHEKKVITILKDVNPPVVTILRPQEGEVVSVVSELSGTAVDDGAGIDDKDIHISFNGTDWLNSESTDKLWSGSVWKYEEDGSNFIDEGEHSFYVWAKDKGGIQTGGGVASYPSVEKAVKRTFVYDKNYPEFRTPENSKITEQQEIFTNSTFNITGILYDSYGLESITYTRKSNNGLADIGTTAVPDITFVDNPLTTTQNWSFSESLTEAGTYTYTFRLRDFAQHETFLVYKVVLDKTAPEIEIVTVSPTVTTDDGDIKINGAAVNVRVNVKEETSGFAVKTYSLTCENSMNNIVDAPIPDNGMITIDTRNLQDGKNLGEVLTFNVKDRAGNNAASVATYLESYIVDQSTDLPVITVEVVQDDYLGEDANIPESNFFDGTKEYLSLSFSDDDGLESLTVKIGNNVMGLPGFNPSGTKPVKNYSLKQMLSTFDAGVYTVDITAVDNALAKTANKKFKISIDTDTPVLTVNATNTYEKGAFTITGTASDSNFKKLSYVRTINNVPGASTELVRAGNNWSLSEPTPASGEYKFVFTATDKVDNVVTETKVIYVDKDAPSVTITDWPDDLSECRNVNFTFRGTASDAGVVSNGLSKVEYSFDGTNWFNVSGTETWNQTIVLASVLTEGNVTFSARATDAVGNVGAVQSKNFVYDKAFPVVAENAIVAKNTSTGTVITTGSTKEKFYISGTAVDSYGITSIVVKQVKDSGAAVVISETDFTLGGTEQSRSWTLENLPRNPSAPGTYNLASGNYVYKIVATDKAGLESEEATFSINIDLDAPNVNLITNPAHNEKIGLSSLSFGTHIFEGNASDTGVGVEKIYYAFTKNATAPAGTDDYAELSTNGNWSFSMTLNSGHDSWTKSSKTELYEGSWYLHVKAADKAENITTNAVTSKFDVDLSKPLADETALNTTSLKQLKNGGDLTITSSDTNGIASIVLMQKQTGGDYVEVERFTAVSGLEPTNKEITVSNLPRNPANISEGTTENAIYEYLITVTDVVGKTENVSRIIQLDTIAPVITVTSPANEYIYDTQTVPIIGIANESGGVGTKNVYYSLNNGSTWTACIGTENWSVPSDVITTEGEKSIWFYAEDKLGNNNLNTPTKINFQIDTAVPTLNITTIPPVIAKANDSIIVAGTASDSNELADVVVSLNGEVVLTDTDGNFSHTFLWTDGTTAGKLSTDNSASYEIKVVATDVVGKKTTQNYVLYCDVFAPQFETIAASPVVTLSNIDYVNGKNVTITGRLNDETKIQSLTYTYEGLGSFVNVPKPGSSDISWNFKISNFDTTVLTDDDVTKIVFTATDSAGNLSTYDLDLNVKQSTDIPVVEYTSMKAGATWANINVSGEFKDSLFGIGNSVIRGTVSDDDGISNVVITVTPDGEPAKTKTIYFGDAISGMFTYNLDEKINDTYVLADGKYTVSVSVTDKFGIQNTPVDHCLIIDRAAPTLIITQLSGSLWAANNPIVVTGTFGDMASDAKLTVTGANPEGDLSGGTATKGITNQAWSYTINAPMGGFTSGDTFTVTARDAYGRSTAYDFIYRIDNMAPTMVITEQNTTVDTSDNHYLSVTAVAPYLIVKGTAADTGSGENMSGIDKVQYSLDSGSTWADVAITGSLGEWTSNIDFFTGKIDGTSYSVVYRSVDKAGNVSTTQVITFKLDNTDPVITETTVGAGLKSTGNNAFSFAGTATDSNGIKSLTYTVSKDNSTPVAGKTALGGTYANWTLAETWNVATLQSYGFGSVETDASGTYEYVFTVKDNSDRITSISRKISLDVTPPSVNIVSLTTQLDANGRTNNVNGIITVNGTITDNVSVATGVYKVEVSDDGITSWSEIISDTSVFSSGVTTNFKFTINTSDAAYSTYDKKYWQITLTATDSAGHISETSEIVYVDSDTDKPIIVLSNAFDTIISSTDVRVDNNLFEPTGNNKLLATITDDDGLDSVVVTTRDAGDNVIATRTYTPSGSTYSLSHTIPSEEGIYKITIEVTDKEVGKSGVVTTLGPFYIGVDAGAPVLNVTTESGKYWSTLTVSGNVLDASGEVTVSASGSDAAFSSQIIDGTKTSSLTPITETTTSKTWSDIVTLPSTTDTYTITYKATDKYGRETSKNFVFNVDTTAPTLNVAAPVNNEITIKKESITAFSGTASDSSAGDSGLKGIYYTILPAVTAAPGAVDTSTWAAANGTTNWSANIDFSGKDEGAYKVYIAAVDNAGNATGVSANIKTVNVDAVVPVATVNVGDCAGTNLVEGETNYRNADFILSGNATDTYFHSAALKVSKDGAVAQSLVFTTGGGASSGDWTYNQDVNALTHENDGTYVYTLTVTDKAGRITTTNATVVIDTTAPTLGLNNFASGECISTESFTFRGVASDNVGLGTTGVQYSHDNSTWHNVTSSGFSWSHQMTGLAESQDAKTIYFRVADKLGNVQTTEAYTYYLNWADPEVNFDLPLGRWRSDFALTVTGTDNNTVSSISSQAAPTGVTIANGAQNGMNTTTASRVFNIYTGPTAVSPVTLTFTVTDKHGRTTQKNFTYTIDLVAPDVNFDEASLGTFYVDSAAPSKRITGTANDGLSGLDQIRYMIVESGLAAPTAAEIKLNGLPANGTNPWVANIDMTSYTGTEDTYAVYVAAYDAAENATVIGAGEIVKLTIDNSNPAAGSVSTTPANVKALFNDDFIIGGTATDSLGLASVTAKIRNSETSLVLSSDPMADKAKTYAWAFNVPVTDDVIFVNDGNYEIIVTATDLCGKISTSSYNFTKDCTVPTVSFTNILDDSGAGQPVTSFTSTDIKILATVTDAVAGLKSYAFKFQKWTGSSFVDATGVGSSGTVTPATIQTTAPVSIAMNSLLGANTDGIYRLGMKMTDDAGNVSADFVYSDCFRVDQTRPTVTLTAPALNTIVQNDALITITGKVKDTNGGELDYVEISISHADHSDVKENFTKKIYTNGNIDTSNTDTTGTLTITSDGIGGYDYSWTTGESPFIYSDDYTITVYAYDKAGNSRDISRDVSCDNTPPLMRFTAPFTMKVDTDGTHSATSQSERIIGNANIRGTIPSGPGYEFSMKEIYYQIGKVDALTITTDGSKITKVANSGLASDIGFTNLADGVENILDNGSNVVVGKWKKTTDSYNWDFTFNTLEHTNLTYKEDVGAPDNNVTLNVYVVAVDTAGNINVATYPIQLDTDIDKPTLEFAAPETSSASTTSADNPMGAGINAASVGGAFIVSGVAYDDNFVHSVYMQVELVGGNYENDVLTSTVSGSAWNGMNFAGGQTAADVLAGSGTTTNYFTKIGPSDDAWYKVTGTNSWRFTLNRANEFTLKDLEDYLTDAYKIGKELEDTPAEIVVRAKVLDTKVSGIISKEGEHGAGNASRFGLSYEMPIFIDAGAPGIVLTKFPDANSYQGALIPILIELTDDSYLSAFTIEANGTTIVTEAGASGWTITKTSNMLWTVSGTFDASGYETNRITLSVMASDGQKTSNRSSSFIVDITPPEATAKDGAYLLKAETDDGVSSRSMTFGGKNLLKIYTGKATISGKIIDEADGSGISKVIMYFTGFPGQADENVMYNTATGSTVDLATNGFEWSMPDSSWTKASETFEKRKFPFANTNNYDASENPNGVILKANPPTAYVVIDTSEGGNEDATNANKDSDGYGENIRADGDWLVNIDSTNIPDGVYTVHYIAMDKSGNARYYADYAAVTNSAPIITSIVLGTDLNNDGVVNTDETGEAGPEDEFFAVADIAETNAFNVRNGKFVIRVNATGGTGAKKFFLRYKDSSGVQHVTDTTADGYSTGVFTLTDFPEADPVELWNYAVEVYDSMTVPLSSGELEFGVMLDNVDDLKPVGQLIEMNTYAEESATATSYDSDGKKNLGGLYKADGKVQGHIEPREYSKHNGNGTTPDLSGNVIVRGEAYDNQMISKIVLSLDGTDIVVAEKTDNVLTAKAGAKLFVNELGQNGHYVEWGYNWDTSTIASVAKNNVVVKVVVSDNKTVPNTSENVNYTTSTNTPRTLENRYFYGDARDGAGFDPLNAWGYNNMNVDVVPYVTELETGLKVYRKTGFDRTARGHYPLNANETFKVKGFNLKGARVNNSVTGVTATSGTEVTIVVNTLGLNTGPLAMTVNGIGIVNNVNDNALETNCTPNNVNNLNLKDDVYVDVWEFDSDAVIPKSGKIEQPVMKINPNNKKIGFAFVNGPLYFSMGGGSGSNNYSYRYWMGSYDFFTSVGFTYDKLGYSYGVAAGGDINSNSADKFQFMTSRWGLAGRGQDGSYAGTNSLRLGSIGQKGDSAGNDTGTNYFDKQKFRSPSLATAVHNTTTYIYMAHYDQMNNEIRFRYGRTNSTAKTEFDSFRDREVNGPPYTYEQSAVQDVQIVAGSNTGRQPGEFVSIDVVSAQGTTVDDKVVMVWYDATNRCLWYTYKANPIANHRGDKTAAGWSTPVRVFAAGTDYENAGEYCKITVDNDGGIHIAAYDPTNLDLCYAYASVYTSNTFETCVVDGCGVTGSNLTLDVAKVDGNWIPYIGYYITSCVKPKLAYLVDTSSNAPEGSVDEMFTGAWECTLVPTTMQVQMQSNQFNQINVGVWKNKDTGVLENSTNTANSHPVNNNGYGQDAYGDVYGNGTSNPVLGYVVKVASNTDNIETAQKR